MAELSVHSEIYCPACGYDLRSLSSDRCPECGMEIDRSRLGESVIPWIHRKKLGRFRAFWKTCWLATMRPKKLAEEMTRRANLDEALRFRRTVVLITLVVIALPLTVLIILNALNETPHHLWTTNDLGGSVFQLLSFPVGWLCIAAWLMLGTGFPSYFFHPSDLPIVQQNRAIAISFYSCAPLAFLPLTLGCCVVVMVGIEYLAGSRTNQILLGAAFILAYGPVLLQFFSIIRCPVALLGAVTHRTGRQWALGFTLPVAWAVLGFILLVVLPAAWMGLGVMALSLRQ